MPKKRLFIFLVTIVFLLSAYLLLANWSIYYRLEKAGLKASDDRHRYVFNEAATSSSQIVYVALGDSLTAGVGVKTYEQSYPYLLAEKISSSSTKITHLNYSYQGARTSDLITNLLAPAISEDPQLVTLLIGINDVHSNISKAEFSRNYENIVKQLKTKTKARIILISLPFIGTDSLLLPPYNSYLRARTASFNEVIEEIAEKNNLSYIDIARLGAVKPGAMSPYYSVDAFHPSFLGYQNWSQIIYENINK